jgi:type II secretory pathway pseudopilin PulG
MRKKDTQKGSLLIEMILAFAIMSIAIVVAVESFSTTQKAYRKTEDAEQVAQALSFLLDEMEREIRVSDSYACAGELPSCENSDSLTMRRIKGVNLEPATTPVQYSLSDASDPGKVIKDVGGVRAPVTPPDIEITTFSISVFSKDEFNQSEPTRILIQVEGKKRGASGVSAIPVFMQTSFATRVL